METGRTISTILIRRCHHLIQIFKRMAINSRISQHLATMRLWVKFHFGVSSA